MNIMREIIKAVTLRKKARKAPKSWPRGNATVISEGAKRAL